MCFLGCSPRHKGIKSLDISTGRVYISRDIVFDENIFPFASLHPNAGTLLRKEILLLPDNLGPRKGDANVDASMPNICSTMPISSPVQMHTEICQRDVCRFVERNVASAVCLGHTTNC